MASDNLQPIIQTTNPWKGLNFYTEKDQNLFYGRDEEIQRLSLYVINNTQSVLYGKSGIGKSSIIQAGIFPIARKSGLLPITIRLSHSNEQSYIDQIREKFKIEENDNRLEIKEIVPIIPHHEESLWEYMHRHQFLQPGTGETIRPLIVIDQFEEIFTLQRDEKRKLAFFSELADLLNEVTPQYVIDACNESSRQYEEKEINSDANFVLNLGETDLEDAKKSYIEFSNFNLVLVLREDFLAHLERYTKFIPVMKSNRFALLPLNEEQAAEIIMQPCSGLVSRDVAELIIRKVTGRQDFMLDGVAEIEVDAAMLSLYLSRLYEKRPTPDSAITAELVDLFGNDIIRDFYEASIADIPSDIVQVLEDELLTYDGRRNNVSLWDLVQMGVPENIIIDLVDNKKLLRQFSYAGDMRIEYMHDTLCKVVQNRIEQREAAAEIARREEENRRFIAEEQAKREKIEREAQIEQERLREETNKIRIQTRKRITVITSIVAAIFLIIGGWYLGWKVPYSQNYVNFTIVYGHPEGVGLPIERSLGSMPITKIQLFNQEKNEFSVLYKLTRRGILRMNPYDKVEIITTDGKPTTNIFIETPVVGLMESELNDKSSQKFANLQKQVVSWRYKQRGTSAMCIALDINKKALYSIQYYRDNTLVSSDSTKYTQWAVFYDGEGKPMMVSDKGTDRMRQTVQNGIVTGSMFFTELGVPQQNAYGSYGYSYEIDSITKLISKRYDVNKYGDKINNTALEFFYDQYGRISHTSAFKILYPQKRMVVYQFEHFCDTLQFSPDGFLWYGTFHAPIGGEYSLLKFKYDKQGRILMNKKYRDDILVESTEYSYAENHYDSITYYVDGEAFVEHYSYPNECTEICSLWKDGNKCELSRQVNEYGDIITYHLCKKTIQTDSVFRNTTLEYFDQNNQLNKTKDQYAKRILREDTIIHKPLLEYCYLANGEIYKSSWYEYDEYGRETARAVAGIEGTPVRCPDWDWDNWCYYKVSMLRDNNSSQIYVAVDGYDEFGDEAYVIDGKNLVFATQPMSMQQVTENGEDTFDIGLRLAQTTKIPLKSLNLIKVPFLHLINKNGTIYTSTSAIIEDTLSCHPKDGDILVSIGTWRLYQSDNILQKEWVRLSKNGGTIEVLRAEGAEYTSHSFIVTPGTLGANYYVMPIKQSQQERIKKAISK